MATVHNPIIPGFNPDPSCICVDGTFYLVTSTFLYYPGIPVYTSKDLQTWKQIGNVVNRPSQIDFSGCRLRPGTQLSGGLWAPTIRHRDGVFYVTTTVVYPDKAYDDFSRWKNVIFSSTNPETNEWSDPIYFDYPGYDTSLFWDDDGKVYVQGSFYWRIREEISQFEIDLSSGKSLSGAPTKIWSGTGGKAPEAPHMYKRNGWYYLLIAEGGTEFGHCATMARSRSVWGPFEPCPQNPILRAASHTALFQTIGHADIFSLESSDFKDKERFYAVCLATRVINEDCYPIGRETCLMEVDWSGEWPVVPGGTLQESVKPPYPQSSASQSTISETDWVDVLRPPHHHLLYLRNPDVTCYNLQQGNQSGIILRASSVPLTAPLGSPTFIGYRQSHLKFEAKVILNTSYMLPETEAGLAVYLDNEHHVTLGIHREESDKGYLQEIRLTRVHPDHPEGELLACKATLTSLEEVVLHVTGEMDKYRFQFSQNDKIEELGTALGRDVSGGFTGVLIAIYGVHSGATKPESKIHVREWNYRGIS
ncbi:hypothetical protein K474DRAFT_1247208 [Panus rudis PR-1116 ss-1]|nr:hypothetical protein K474DRAFT_1247208 [Panus rudis PR-1116 ss-1]